MNALNMAQTAYATAQAPIRTPRSIEFEAFARTTRRLKAAAAKGRDGFKELVSAIQDNRRLWNILAADVADAGNRLPASLRAQLFYLAEFTNHHSSEVLRGEADADVLVDINMTIMRGLRDEGART